nr:MAG TPA: hypothetical protein [Caudoviricetes sp.]
MYSFLFFIFNSFIIRRDLIYISFILSSPLLIV